MTQRVIYYECMVTEAMNRAKTIGERAVCEKCEDDLGAVDLITKKIGLR